MDGPDTETIRKGVNYLLDTQLPDGHWYDAVYTAPGFPRVFYLKYHGYSKYFPLWALPATATGSQNRLDPRLGVIAALPAEAGCLHAGNCPLPAL